MKVEPSADEQGAPVSLRENMERTSVPECAAWMGERDVEVTSARMPAATKAPIDAGVAT